MMLRVALLSCLIFVGAFSVAHAQSLTGLERELNLTLQPSHPGPGQLVNLSVDTYALKLPRSVITWFVNGEEVAKGPDLRNFNVTAGNLGSETEIVVIAEDDEGLTASAKIIIRPTEVDLLWEANSYVPPLYMGRVLPGTNSSIRAHALARFQTDEGVVPESDIVYTWFRNGAIVAEGRGKSSVVVSGPAFFGTDTLRVVAVSVNKLLSGEARVSIPSVEPFVTLHENHPLFGVLYHRSLEPGATTLETEQRVTAVPYFASIHSPEDAGLLYDWFVNDEQIQPDPNEPQTLTITTEGYSGPADIGLTLLDTRDALLRASGKWQLLFGEQFSIFSNTNPFSGE